MYLMGPKRALDTVFSVGALIALSPLIALVALATKILDPGPVIFSQQRVGINQCIFTLYKFRSMPVNTGDIPSDQLVQVKLSSIGAFLRRSNLDELPQLFNVLRGDMSLVGPRPALLSQKDLINARAIDGAYNIRPGLTGLAQVNSYDGMTVDKKAQFDCQYANSINFLADCRICIQTVGYLLRKPPVY